MIHRIVLGVFAVIVFTGLSVRADYLVIRGQDRVKGTIKSEDAAKVVFLPAPEKGKKSDPLTVKAGDVVDMILDDGISPTSLTTKGEGAYRIAVDAEDAADTDNEAVRTKNLGIALTKYNETLKKMVKNTTAQKNAARHVQYKIAILTARQAADRGGRLLAVQELQKFKDDHNNCWQIHTVMPEIARLQMDLEDFSGAAKTFEEMSNMKVLPLEVQRDAALRVVEVAVREKKIKLAHERLDALEKNAKETPGMLARVKLARADVYFGEKQVDKAVPILQELVKDTKSDKQIKAMAHNMLGESLFNASKYNEALWEFLWVEAVFNQEPSQHAKSLYYLWKTFEQLNQQDRASDCLDMLLNDRRFTGTEWQVKAAKSK